MSKAHILIVEDEALLYKRLRKVLEKEYYSIDEYAPSVEDAIARINIKRPDIVLLDIDLEGELTGIDLGKQLNETYNIPFIYITGFGDDQTFYEGLNTHHEHFIVKTKPRLDSKEVVRAIQTTLNKKDNKPFLKEGIFGLVEYLDRIREAGNKEITRVPVRFEDIAFFTVKPFINQDGEEEELRANYLWFQTISKNEEHYFLKTSLTDLLNKLPYYFVRINESYVVNISPEILGGRINGSRISIFDRDLTISETYKKEVKKRFDLFYQK